MEQPNIHASCVALGAAGKPFSAEDQGVLLLGPSGAGKSDLALRLIGRGCELVADDRTELFLQHGALHARAPGTLAGLIEVRGAGIIELPFRRQAQIALAVELVAADAVPRMPQPARYVPPPPVAAAAVPLLRLCAFEPSSPEKVIHAVAAFAENLFRDNVKKI